MKKQLDHALVLFIECVKNNVIEVPETKHSNINKNASLLQQLNTIYKWVNNCETYDSPELYTAKIHLNSVLPENTNKLFGSRTAANNMKKLMGTTLSNISTNYGMH